MTETKIATKELTKENLEEIKKLTEEKKQANIVPVELKPEEQKEIEETFSSVKDFRTLWEKITAPIDNIIERTSKIIESDPIMDVSWELKKINDDVQSVYKEIIDDDSAFTKFLKKIPLLWDVVEKFDNTVDELKFDMKSIKWKIEIIFSWFDQSYESLNKSIQMQQEFLEWLDQNLGKVKSYKEYVEKKLEEFKQKAQQITDEKEKEKYDMFIRNVEFFIRNLETLIGNLELARKRLLIRLDSAVKLALAMSSSRPIFKTLLSVAILETSGQKAIDASMKSIEVMWDTIDKMSSELTDKAIESSRKAEEMTSKPVLDTKVFIENVEKLKRHFETIEQYREQVKKEAEEERKLFNQATKDLENIKTWKSQDFTELQNELEQK
jgi:DNA repair exonuclease SbcCD ATPase subunit